MQLCVCFLGTVSATAVHDGGGIAKPGDATTISGSHVTLKMITTHCNGWDRAHAWGSDSREGKGRVKKGRVKVR